MFFFVIILGDMHPSFYISGFIFDDVVGKTGILRFRLYIATQWLPFLHLFVCKYDNIPVSGNIFDHFFCEVVFFYF